jgi:mRNA interferase RelE/StbE
MPYRVTLKKQAIKALQTVNEPYYSKLKEAIYALAHNPRPYGYKKLRGRSGYRIKVAHYRIIYEIFDDILLVDVIEVGDRKDIYD